MPRPVPSHLSFLDSDVGRDMIRLLEDRIWIAEGRHRNGPGAKTDRHGNVIDLGSDRKARNKA